MQFRIVSKMEPMWSIILSISFFCDRYLQIFAAIYAVSYIFKKWNLGGQLFYLLVNEKLTSGGH